MIVQIFINFSPVLFLFLSLSLSLSLYYTSSTLMEKKMKNKKT